MMSPETSLAQTLQEHLNPGDHVWIEEACGEPTLLVDALCEAAKLISNLTVYVGWSLRQTPLLQAPVNLRSLMGLGARGGSAFGYLPIRYASVPKLIDEGILRVDAVLIQVAPPDRGASCALSVQAGWIPAALRSATTVIAEINAQLPIVKGFPSVPRHALTAAVEVNRPLLSYSVDSARVPKQIGELVASIVPDDAALEFGPGPAVSAALRELASRGVPLRIVSGLLTDDVVDLHLAGCLEPDQQVSATMLCGTDRLLSWASEDPRLTGLPLERSHHLGTLIETQRFVALNSAHAVDLTGSVDTEDLDSGVTGGLGGHADFSLAATMAPGGRSIVALPATKRGASTIQLKVRSTTARSDVDFVVTEHGIAELRGRTLGERAIGLIEIAAPEHRRGLRAGAEAAGLLGTESNPAD